MAAGGAGEAGRPDRAVALLAADVERLSRAVEKIEETANTAVRTASGTRTDTRAQLDAVREQVTELGRQVAGLAALGTQVSALADRVAQLATTGGGAGGVGGEEGSEGAGLLSWFDADAEQAAQLLVDLAQWVYEVLAHYRQAAQQISDCWRRHPSAVEGLLALRLAWYAAYRDPEAKPTAAVDWHTRQLPGVVDLLREELRGCSEHSHAPDGDVARFRRSHPRVEPDEEMLTDYAVWWADHHGGGTEPRLPAAPAPAGGARQPYGTTRPGA